MDKKSNDTLGEVGHTYEGKLWKVCRKIIGSVTRGDRRKRRKSVRQTERGTT